MTTADSPPAQVVFLRGVNVGGVTMKSAALRDCLARIKGIEAVRTVLASGNAVVRSALSVDTLKDAAEGMLRDEFGYAAWVVVLSLDEVADLVERCPYAFDDPAVHAYLTLTSDWAALDAWEQVATELGQDHARLSPTALAWTCPAGQSLKVPFAEAQTKKPLSTYAHSVTTRNGRTLLRVLSTAEHL